MSTSFSQWNYFENILTVQYTQDDYRVKLRETLTTSVNCLSVDSCCSVYYFYFKNNILFHFSNPFFFLSLLYFYVYELLPSASEKIINCFLYLFLVHIPMHSTHHVTQIAWKHLKNVLKTFFRLLHLAVRRLDIWQNLQSRWLRGKLRTTEFLLFSDSITES